jgi:branched-chain amino acid transport system ATP-binding protein
VSALLSLNSVEVIYDRTFLVVKGVSLEVPEGGMVALLGANGAGKSTTLKAVSGLLGPERGDVARGTIHFRGTDLAGVSPPERVRLGLCHVLEGRRVFEHLTPVENLTAAARRRDGRSLRDRMDRVFSYFPRLAERRGARAGYLSGGEQQMLAIGRALMTEPRLLLLDEPSLGLAPYLVKEIFEIVRRINRDEGMGILLVEQNAIAALDIVSHAYLIEQGRIVMSGPPEVLTQNPDIQDFYLGGHGGYRRYQEVKHYRRRKRFLA